MKKEPSPSEQLTEFLNYLDRLSAEYKCAADVVKTEPGSDSAAQQSEAPAANKDIVMRDELVVSFFEEPENRKVLNKLRQLLGRQRKQEEFLASDRVYKPRG